MRPTALVLLLCLVTAVAGCSAKEGSPDPTPTATPTTSDTATTAAAGDTTTSASSSTSVAPRPAQTFDVDIEGNSFVDGSLTVQKGDTVRWTQRDTAQHTVTADDDSFDSGTMLPLGPSSTFSHTFDAIGDAGYHCEVHPSMQATITVVEALPA